MESHADKSPEQMSRWEAWFERGRRRFGLVSAPLAFLLLILRPVPGLEPRAHNNLGLLPASVVMAVVMSEFISNTATVSIVVPIVIATAGNLHLDPVGPVLGATMGASLGFMLPVPTPCNALVYGSGLIPLGRMILYGILLDVAGGFVIVLMVWLLRGLL